MVLAPEVECAGEMPCFSTFIFVQVSNNFVVSRWSYNHVWGRSLMVLAPEVACAGEMSCFYYLCFCPSPEFFHCFSVVI